LRLSKIELKVEVYDDAGWTLAKDGKNRAFPGGFIPSVARSWMKFSLENPAKNEVKTRVLLPFDASAKPGTGFTGFKSFSVVDLDTNQPVEVSPGPEKLAHMFSLRTFVFQATVPAGAKKTYRVVAEHRLALNPAWYRFVCQDRYHRVPKAFDLAAPGCSIDFSLDDKVAAHKGYKLEVQTSLAGKREVNSDRYQDSVRLSLEKLETLSVYPVSPPPDPLCPMLVIPGKLIGPVSIGLGEKDLKLAGFTLADYDGGEPPPLYVTMCKGRVAQITLGSLLEKPQCWNVPGLKSSPADPGFDPFKAFQLKKCKQQTLKSGDQLFYCDKGGLVVGVGRHFKTGAPAERKFDRLGVIRRGMRINRFPDNCRTMRLIRNPESE